MDVPASRTPVDLASESIAPPFQAGTAADAERQEGAWQVRPVEGTFEVVYEDARGAWTTRTLEARELKLGPGRTLLGGIDRASGLYRGLRVDRIRRLSDPATSVRLETGILDWLLVRAAVQRRARLMRARAARRSALDVSRRRRAA